MACPHPGCTCNEFAVDGYRFGEWSLIDAGARIAKLIEQTGS